jgi:hypothetical protein
MDFTTARCLGFNLGLRQAPSTADEVANLDIFEEEVLADG